MTEKIKLSPSKLKCFSTCSWLYSLRYSGSKTFPNPSNDGQSRGNVCHYILECLGNKNKKNRGYYVEKILSTEDPFIIPSVKRMVFHHAKKLSVCSDSNIKMIRAFILAAIKNDFFCDGSLDLIIEEGFNYEGKNFILNGYLDKVALYKDKVVIHDYKTSKARFSGEELEFNYQNLIYTFAIKKKYPGFPVEMIFQFLKYTRAEVNQMAPFVSDAELSGLESHLEDMAEFLTDFDEKKAKSNFAKNNDKNRWLCGKLPGEMNAAGTAPAFVCPAKFPRTYFVLKDSSGKFIKSDFEKKNLDKYKKEGYTIETAFYGGCPAHAKLYRE